MRAVSLKRAKLNRIRRTLMASMIEEGAPCEARLDGCTRWATDGHEILTRARRGSITDRKNVCLICRHCHCIITRESGKSGWAVRHGWVLASWSTPEEAERAACLRLELRCPVDCEIDHR